MHPFNLCSWRMPLLVSTDTKLDKLHLQFFFFWTFTALISFHTILCYSFQEQPHLGQSKTLPVLWKISEILFLQIDFFNYFPLAIITIFILCFFFFNFHDSKHWKSVSWLLGKTYLHISGQVTENFPWLFWGVASPIHSFRVCYKV